MALNTIHTIHTTHHPPPNIFNGVVCLHTARLVSLLRVCRVSVPPILSPGRPFSCCARGGVKPRPWLAGTVVLLYHKILRRELRFSDCNFSSCPRTMVVVSGILRGRGRW